MNLFGWEIKRKPKELVEEKAEVVLEKRRMKISESLRERLNEMGEVRTKQTTAMLPVRTEFDITPYTPPKGVAPASHVLAMDSTINYASMGITFSGSGFPGFAYLTELSQLTEYRDMSERTAAEMTRKWIKLRSKSDEDRTEEIEKIEDEMRRLKLRELFRKAAEMDGLMGRAQLFIDLGIDQGPELAAPLVVSKLKVGKGRLRGLKLVEPINTYPNTYNSNNPLSPEFYNPSTWYVQGMPVHSSRLLTFVSRPLPDLLKPAYNFSGMSLSQLAQPYVDYWLETRDAVGKLLKNFSTSILKTNMQDVLEGGSGSTLLARAKVYNAMRDNQGIFLLDRDTEDFAQVNTPIGGLSQLQAQAQEHMAAVAKTPLVVLLGVSPTGLNASSEGEIRVFYDYVADQQEKLFRPNLEIILQVIQLNLFGEVYEDITFDFVNLYAMSATEQSSIRSSDVTAAVALIGAGVLSPKEERERLAKNPDSGYDSINVDDVPEPPAPPMPPGGGQPPPGKGKTGAPNAPQATKPGQASKLPKLTEKTDDEKVPGDAAFFGNQHTGTIAASDDSPYVIAVKSSAVASNATATANTSPTKRNFERALEAHKRALEAHQAALEDESPSMELLHQVYEQTHREYIKRYTALIKERQALLDARSDAGEVAASASPAMDGEASGHAFRGNQYKKVGAATTPSGAPGWLHSKGGQMEEDAHVMHKEAQRLIREGTSEAEIEKGVSKAFEAKKMFIMAKQQYLDQGDLGPADFMKEMQSRVDQTIKDADQAKLDIPRRQNLASARAYAKELSAKADDYTHVADAENSVGAHNRAMTLHDNAKAVWTDVKIMEQRHGGTVSPETSRAMNRHGNVAESHKHKADDLRYEREKAEWQDAATAARPDVEHAVATYSKKLGVTVEVRVTDEKYTFYLNGEKKVAAGTAHIHESPAYIKIYAGAFHGDSAESIQKHVGQVLAHEQGHILFQRALDAYKEESARMMKDPRVGPKPLDGGVMRADGTLVDHAKAEFPHHDKLGEAFHAIVTGKKLTKADKLEKEDGVTSYSREWWDAYHKNTATREQALHETFAEVHKFANSTDKTLFTSEVKPTWRSFYKTIVAIVGPRKRRKK